MTPWTPWSPWTRTRLRTHALRSQVLFERLVSKISLQMSFHFLLIEIFDTKNCMFDLTSRSMQCNLFISLSQSHISLSQLSLSLIFFSFSLCLLQNDCRIFMPVWGGYEPRGRERRVWGRETLEKRKL